MAQDSRPALFMGSLIGSGVGFLLLILADFGGSYSYSSYTGISERYYVGPNTPLGFFTFLILGLPLLYCAMISFRGVRNLEAVTQRTVSRAFKLSVLQLGLVFVGAIVFVVASSAADDWWFGAGFYGPAIGGILAAICLSSAGKSFTGAIPLTTTSLPGTMQRLPDPAAAVPRELVSAATVAGSAPPDSFGHPWSGVEPRFCGSCGSSLPGGDRFCPNCGAAM